MKHSIIIVLLAMILCINFLMLLVLSDCEANQSDLIVRYEDIRLRLEHK